MRTRDANVNPEDPWHLLNICAPLLVKEIPFPAGKKDEDAGSHRGRGAGCRIPLCRCCRAEITATDGQQMMDLLCFKIPDAAAGQ